MPKIPDSQDPDDQDPDEKISARELIKPERVSSDALLGPARQLIIVHGGREYRLRRTQNGRLILTA